MNRSALCGLAAAVTLLFCASVETRAASRTFVSAKSGSDANACTITAPCKTFAGALAKTSVKGDIIVLDAGEYGKVTITKSVSIIAEGVYASLSTSSGAAVSINAAATDVVVLRGLTLRMLPSTSTAYGINSVVGTLHVENCNISGFSAQGIFINSVAGSPCKALIKDTTVRDNGSYGIWAAPSGPLKVTIENSRSENNQNAGLVASGFRALVTCDGSVFSGNEGDGIQNLGAQVNLEHCMVSNNTHIGVGNYETGSITRISNSVVTNNANIGLFNQANNTFETRGNNLVRGNSPDKQGTFVVISGG